MNYHTKFANIKDSAIGLTYMLFSPEFFDKSDEDKLKHMNDWLRAMSAIYDVPNPLLVLSTPEECDLGEYIPTDDSVDALYGKIVLPKLSVVSLIHEFRHHLQVNEAAKYSSAGKDNEEDARAWSLSLLYLARPAMFKQSVKKGYILYVDADELLA